MLRKNGRGSPRASNKGRYVTSPIEIGLCSPARSARYPGSRGGGRFGGDTSPESWASRSRRSGWQSRRNGGESSFERVELGIDWVIVATITATITAPLAALAVATFLRRPSRVTFYFSHASTHRVPASAGGQPYAQ